MKKVLLSLGGGAIVVFTVGALWIHRVKTNAPHREGELVLEGLSAPVEILRDSLGVPHIWADSNEDLFFGQGFVHATDRLWQMEMFRRVAEGRLSEIFGEPTLDSDRFLRTLAFDRAAARSLEAAPEEVRSAFEAYALGANAAIAHWEGPLPPEFLILRTRPLPWEPVFTAAIEKIMAWDLADYGIGLSLAQAQVALGDDGRFEPLMPRVPEWGVTILGDTPADYEESPRPPTALAPPGATGATGARAGGEDAPPRESVGGPAPEREPNVAMQTGIRAEALAGLWARARVPEAAAEILDGLSTVRASNSWVVGPSRSVSGAPLLANDMHLGLNHPTIWYLVGLHAPGLDVVGMSLPGTPGVTAGHSGAVAWGYTNANVDDSDFFIERADPADDTRYLTPEGSEAFIVRDEAIRVRGREEEVAFRVRETRHGPIMTDVEPRAGGELLAFQWVGREISSTLGTILEMNRARTVEELIAALPGFDNPHQNVVFADTAGNFGYWMAGRVPIRRNGHANLLPKPGWTGEYDWIGFVPFEEHPHAVNPEQGFVATANNRQTWAPSSTMISNGRWAPPHRAGRITELIESRDLHDAESMLAIQLDAGGTVVGQHVNRAVESFRAAGLGDPADDLAGWDGQASLTSTEATLFYSWMAELRALMRTRLYGENRGYFPRRLVEEALAAEDPSIENLRVEAAATAFERSAGREWGEVHHLVLGHPLAQVPVVGRVFGFGRGPFPREGSFASPNVAGYGGRQLPFRVTAGPSQRHVVDMADVDRWGGFILPGGQSGLPAHQNSWDQLERWKSGTLWRVPVGREPVERRALHRLYLIPPG